MPTKRKTNLRADKFIQTLVNETPKFDEMILKDIRPLDSWICYLPPAPRLSLWNRIRAWIALKLRFISGWIMPKTPVDETKDRFTPVWPKLSEDWAPMIKRDRIKPRKKKKK